MNPTIFALTIASFSIDITRGSIHARTGTREVFITREPGQPFTFFSGRREGVNREVWGLGLYAVTTPAVKGVIGNV